jgi:hypothetical protein
MILGSVFNTITIAQEDDDEANITRADAFIRVWYLADPRSPDICIVLKPSEGDPDYIARSLPPCRLKNYRKIAVGPSRLLFGAKVNIDIDDSKSWESQPRISSMKRVGISPVDLDLAGGDCATVLITGAPDHFASRVIKDVAPESGIRVRFINLMPEIKPDVGLTSKSGDQWLWQDLAEIEVVVDLPKPKGFRYAFVDFPGQGNRRARREREMDFDITPMHTLIMHRDRYGRLSVTATEDGLSAALASD